MSHSDRAVFLSYASEDADVAQRLARALETAGIEVWFDRAALRGGDAWDNAIREQIQRCHLFLPVISAHTQARAEGYFRLEWKLAVDRSQRMAHDEPFLLPVVVDDTADAAARVPEAFRQVQWTRLAAGTLPALVARVQYLLSPGRVHEPERPRSAGAPGTLVRPRRLRSGWHIVILVTALIGGAALVGWWSASKGERGARTAAPDVAAPATRDNPFHPPPHSIAVLPFANLSGDPAQEYFSDGVSEELINALAHVETLQVTARTSAFAFKGQSLDIGTIARRLNVGVVIEGSVRREADTVRISAELIDATSGYHLWSENYDRALQKILVLQTEIATTIAGALRAKLDGKLAERIEAGGTDNPQAYDAYLLGSKLLTQASAGVDEADDRAALGAFDRAIAFDARFAAAHVRRAATLVNIVVDTRDARSYQRLLQQAAAAADTGIRLAPEFADGYAQLAIVKITAGDFMAAQPAVERARALDPGNVRVQRAVASLESRLGHAEAGIAAARRAVLLDPLSSGARFELITSLLLAERFAQGLAAAQEAAELNPSGLPVMLIPLFHYFLGDAAKAKALCESPGYAGHATDLEHVCLALANHALGDTTGAARELKTLQERAGDSGASGYADIYAQWGDAPEALSWLEKAYELHDPGVQAMKVSPFLKPIRAEPRFQALQRRLNFPP